MTEADIQAHIMREIGSLPNVRLFRQNVGTGWVGKFISLKHGMLILQDARPLHAGLFVGSSDLIGWTSKVITEADVGRSLAIFTSLECKTNSGRPSPEQINWIEAIKSYGGYAGVVRGPAEARAIIQS